MVGEAEQEFLGNVITTSLTAIYRENHHFECLCDRLIPDQQYRQKLAKAQLSAEGFGSRSAATDHKSSCQQMLGIGVWSLEPNILA